jgi:hypothetical protein
LAGVLGSYHPSINSPLMLRAIAKLLLRRVWKSVVGRVSKMTALSPKNSIAAWRDIALVAFSI